MATFIEYGETIEGDSVDIQVRKWVPGSIVKLAAVKKNMYNYWVAFSCWMDLDDDSGVYWSRDLWTCFQEPDRQEYLYRHYAHNAGAAYNCVHCADRNLELITYCL